MSRFKKAAVILGAFLLGGAITFVGIRLVFSELEWLGILLAPVWALTVFGGTFLLPESVTVAYDPIGHPVLHLVGIVLNAVFLSAIPFTVFIGVKRLYRGAHE